MMSLSFALPPPAFLLLSRRPRTPDSRSTRCSIGGRENGGEKASHDPIANSTRPLKICLRQISVLTFRSKDQRHPISVWRDVQRLHMRVHIRGASVTSELSMCACLFFSFSRAPPRDHPLVKKKASTARWLSKKSLALHCSFTSIALAVFTRKREESLQYLVSREKESLPSHVGQFICFFNHPVRELVT